MNNTILALYNAVYNEEYLSYKVYNSDDVILENFDFAKIKMDFFKDENSNIFIKDGLNNLINIVFESKITDNKISRNIYFLADCYEKLENIRFSYISVKNFIFQGKNKFPNLKDVSICCDKFDYVEFHDLPSLEKINMFSQYGIEGIIIGKGLNKLEDLCISSYEDYKKTNLSFLDNSYDSLKTICLEDFLFKNDLKLNIFPVLEKYTHIVDNTTGEKISYYYNDSCVVKLSFILNNVEVRIGDSLNSLKKLEIKSNLNCYVDEKSTYLSIEKVNFNFPNCVQMFSTFRFPHLKQLSLTNDKSSYDNLFYDIKDNDITDITLSKINASKLKLSCCFKSLVNLNMRKCNIDKFLMYRQDKLKTLSVISCKGESFDIYDQLESLNELYFKNNEMIFNYYKSLPSITLLNVTSEVDINFYSKFTNKITIHNLNISPKVKFDKTILKAIKKNTVILMNDLIIKKDEIEFIKDKPERFTPY